MGIAVSSFTVGLVPDDPPEPSGFGRRALAWGADVALMWVLVVFTCLVAVMLPELPGALVGLYAVLGVVPTYLTYFHGSPTGQTPGKRLLGIAVRTDDGGRLGYQRALKRAVALVVIALIPVVNILALVRPARHPQRHAYHDDVAHTVVVRVKDDYFD
jgi:uncharacterized RDD family membrane protein YckC